MENLVKSLNKNLFHYLKSLYNKLINLSEFNEEYNKFMNDVKGFEDYKAEKNPGSVSINQQKMRGYVKSLKNIVDFYNPQSDNVMIKKGEGLKILTNKQMLNRLPVLLAQIQASNNSKSLKNEARQILYALYRSKALTKTVYNKLVKSIRE